MPVSRNLAGTIFVGGALILTLSAIAYPTMLGVQNTSSSPTRVIANTRYGPLTEMDRDFVVKVRAAGLWEYPLGEIALKKGSTPEMREAGKHLIVGHARLDEMCRQIAVELNITLPNQASPQQQQFIATSVAQSGKQFDTTAANIMRVTHGQIFPAIAKVRATTENSLVRKLANLANDTVLDHITMMEKTGTINFGQVLAQQNAAPSLPKDQVTPPPPPQGAPVVVLTARPDLKVNTASPTPSPTVG
jgi:predicted outer membrane protein